VVVAEVDGVAGAVAGTALAREDLGMHRQQEQVRATQANVLVFDRGFDGVEGNSSGIRRACISMRNTRPDLGSIHTAPR